MAAQALRSSGVPNARSSMSRSRATATQPALVSRSAGGGPPWGGSDTESQLGLYERRTRRPVAAALDGPAVPDPSVGKPCAACRTKEARYGFREADRPGRPRTLCFECFRMEINRRQAIAAQLARGWNATQTELPLAETLNELSLRRRRAQIAARRAIGTDAGA
ncbi:MAG TPA: hypothetical protein VGQ10_06275 [Vicinamibacterales bacterium]|nr:hypothetical protein [Vicinamibacterales bacterium]